MKIKSVEEAVALFHENAKKKFYDTNDALKHFIEYSMKHGESTKNGNYRTGNKCFQRVVESIAYLYEHDATDVLMPLLDDEHVNVRLMAAYALLPIEPLKGAAALKEIEEGNYGIFSLNAKYTLQQWQKGELAPPYEPL